MKLSLKFLPFLILLFSAIGVVKAEITLPKIFSNNMVLQRNAEVLLYGWAAPNEEFKIYTSWNKITTEVKADVNAKWQLKIETPEAGGPYNISFTGTENTIVLENVLMGEVWLCSGQSNMEWSANSGIDNKEIEIENANYPNIRLFTVQKRTSEFPQEDVSGNWEVCTPETMPNFSAIAYFFARKVQKELGIPIGLIDSSWGASCAEVWTPAAVFEEFPELVTSHKLLEPNQWVSNTPSSLYNAMISPLTNFQIGGVLWYQGETNTANAEGYQHLFTEMIRSWRKEWETDFPFYYVQIAPFKYGRPYEGGVLRDQQRRTLVLADTGMAMTSDICTVDDIHPQNKQDVGLRLANIALKNHFDVMDGEVYGPLFKDAAVAKGKVKLVFDHAQNLFFKDKNQTLFELMNEDGKWYSAKAKIKNDFVTVSSKEVAKPKSVRFAWKSDAISNLFNEAGLPASSFKFEFNN